MFQCIDLACFSYSVVYFTNFNHLFDKKYVGSLTRSTAELSSSVPCLNAYCLSEAVRTGPPQGQPLPPDYGPPPYEGPHPGFLPPHVPGEGPMPMPMPMPPPPQGAADCLQT